MKNDIWVSYLIIGAITISLSIVSSCIVQEKALINRQLEIDKAALAAGLCQVQNAGMSGTWPYYHYEACPAK